ncbi:DUF1194 domain-containing protein [Bradyrhizobium sp. CNPSo 4010]|uniref:DUF1194 domain-containing protein n=1 Tax=Bradyrhizobium agreste TaxID=2751811 RepID=A0ABS0PV30_9BRAD|nr:DUF1194 domain-containing protein [Bradyrhizobium agreste]
MRTGIWRAIVNWRISIGSILIAMLTSAHAFSEPASQPKTAAQGNSRPVVDVELVIAVDVSYSVEPDVLAAQREGYAKAIVSKEFLRASRAGPSGKMALTYFEWSSTGDQKIIVSWRQIDGPESAEAAAAEIMKAPIRRGSRTSISSAIKFAVSLIEQSPYRGTRRIIDISGDGPNSNGDPVTTARDTALQQGIVITGLPIMTFATPADPTDFQHIDHIDWYYEDCVIGGPGSFVVPITGRENFKEAIQTKLVLEVAGRTPNASTAPSVNEKPRVLCTIGEKLWQERWLSNSPATFGPPAKSPVAISPVATNPVANDDTLKKEDAALSKKIKGICRGC